MPEKPPHVRQARIIVAAFTEDVRKTCEDVKRRMIEGNGELQ